MVFQKISIFVDLESKIALVGENGSGKITLVKLLTRYEHTQKPQGSFTQHHVDQLVMDTVYLNENPELVVISTSGSLISPWSLENSYSFHGNSLVMRVHVFKVNVDCG